MTNQKAKRKQKTCKHCKKRFDAIRSTAVFCSESCGSAFRRSEQDKDTLLRKYLSQTGFFSYLQYQSRRAGTVEIVPKKLEDLVELHAVWSYNNKANAFKKDREYELSHVLPVTGVSGKIGSLHPSNIVVQPASFNRKHSNRYLGNGHCINAYRLKPEFEVDEYETKAEILDKIFKRIGITTLKLFKTVSKPKKLAKIIELEWFEKNVDSNDRSINLHDLDLEQLRKIKADLTGKREWNSDWIPFDRDTVLLVELNRLSSHRQELQAILDWWADHVVDEGGFWSMSAQEAGNDAFRSRALDLLQPVLVGAVVDLDALFSECYTAYEVAYNEYEHKEKVKTHIRALEKYGVIMGVPFSASEYVFVHTGKPFDEDRALDVQLPECPWNVHSDYPNIAPVDLVCYLPDQFETDLPEEEKCPF